jgi:hypothetical protein
MARGSFGYIRKLPSKKYQASYVKPNGTRVNAPYTFLTRGDASAWLSSEQVNLSKGVSASTSKPKALAEDSPIFETYVERITRTTGSDASNQCRGGGSEGTLFLYWAI